MKPTHLIPLAAAAAILCTSQLPLPKRFSQAEFEEVARATLPAETVKDMTKTLFPSKTQDKVIFLAFKGITITNG